MYFTLRLPFVASVCCFFVWLGALLPALSQAQPTVIASGLASPLGLEMDARGRLWVAEQGTGNDDGRIVVITADGMVHPFLEGLRSIVFEGSPTSAYHLTFHNGSLYAAHGYSTDSPEGYVLRADTTGFTPGDTPLQASDVERIDIGTFAIAEGVAETNVYNLMAGPDDDLYIVDAGGNAVYRRDAATGDLSLFTTFEALPNPTPVGPPFIHAVPTAIVFADNRFFVSTLTGFPFVPGLARVYEINTDGTIQGFQDGLTSLVDLAVHPQNGTLIALQMAEFGFEPPPPGFRPMTGAVVALKADGPHTLVDGLNFPTGLTFDADGNLYLASMTGDVLLIDAALVTDTEEEPDLPTTFMLHPNYPNPFNPATTLRFEMQRTADVSLHIYDLLGRVVHTLAEGPRVAGVHEVAWNGRDASGAVVPSGLYLARMEMAGQVQTRSLLLIK